jgi:hypothetical protein
MDSLVIVALLFVAALFFLIFLVRNRTSTAPAEQLHYRRRPALFTPAERSFAGVLDQVLDTRYRVYGKVRVADLIEPLPTKDRRIWQKAFNRISAKHFDFVICNSSDLVPVVVIELDDSSHQKAKRQQRDEMLQQICGQVQLPLIRPTLVTITLAPRNVVVNASGLPGGAICTTDIFQNGLLV